MNCGVFLVNGGKCVEPGPIDSFTPISLVASAPQVLLATASLQRLRVLGHALGLRTRHGSEQAKAFLERATEQVVVEEKKQW